MHWAGASLLYRGLAQMEHCSSLVQASMFARPYSTKTGAPSFYAIALLGLFIGHMAFFYFPDQ